MESVDSRAALIGLPILIVEDNQESARLMALLLTKAGADVRRAATAEEALNILRSFPARVLVLDLILPGMSGVRLTEQLKSTPSTRDIVIIAVTVLDGLETERVALQAGCAAYVQKPIDINAFTETVTRCLKDEVIDRAEESS